MEDTYLPADVRKRIIDVMRERKLTQRELALRIDVNESTISRFLSGKTEKLSEESVIRIARVFNVSTDFILGTTVIPDKKNYDISELGLSVEAAKNLYTGKVNNDVVKHLVLCGISSCKGIIHILCNHISNHGKAGIFQQTMVLPEDDGQDN